MMLRQKTRHLWLGVTILLLGSMLGASLAANASPAHQAQSADTPTFTANLTITSTPTAPPHMVISEFRSRGPNGDSDEFIELYNPTGASVNISGWILRQSSGCGATITNLAFITSNVILLAGQHYLLTSSLLASVSGADQFFSAGIFDNGGLALLTSAGQIVDQVGMCISTTYREGANLEPLTRNLSQSYERRPGGDTACYDTDNNEADFVLISPPNPQNKASRVVMCSGVTTYTPTLTMTPTSTRTITPSPTTIPGSVVINEFLPHPHTDWNADGTADVGDEYIELMNMGFSSINIHNWKLDTGANTTAFILPDMVMQSHEILVFYHSQTGLSLSDGGGSVRLVKSDGHTADIFNYPAVEFTDRTWCRLPDGNGAWDFTCNPSPKKPNVLYEAVRPTPLTTATATPIAGCPWAKGVPAAVSEAECSGIGAGIWNARPSSEFWLPFTRKWQAFIE